MDLPRDQDDVSIHVIKVVLKASYRGTTHNFLERPNDGFIKSVISRREREKRAKKRV